MADHRHGCWDWTFFFPYWRQRERHWMLKPQSWPHLLYSLNKAILPNPSQTVLPAGDQAFQYESMGDILIQTTTCDLGPGSRARAVIWRISKRSSPLALFSWAPSPCACKVCCKCFSASPASPLYTPVSTHSSLAVVRAELFFPLYPLRLSGHVRSWIGIPQLLFEFCSILFSEKTESH